MCFRPADAGQSLECPECGKKVNAIMGNWPLNCPFCDIELADAIAALEGGAAPAPAAPAPAAPAAPAAPKAPAAPAAPVPPAGE